MKARRVFCENTKTSSERAAERAIRDEFQREKPSLEDLVRAGQCDPEDAMSMGQYYDLQRALQALRGERERAGLSITDVASRSGLDRAVISRLETGKQDNPTATTLMRYAAAIGKRLLWTYEDLPAEDDSQIGIRRKARKKVRKPN
jgi:ribosome-binding protein aMBF1 (putative translation factor)